MPSEGKLPSSPGHPASSRLTRWMVSLAFALLLVLALETAELKLDELELAIEDDVKDELEVW
jgi:hypothetical protein